MSKTEIVAHSVERWRGKGGQTVTKFNVYRREDEKNASLWVEAIGYGKTPGERKTDAIKNSGLLPTAPITTVAPAPVYERPRVIPGWLGALAPETRERAFVVMREIDNESLRYLEKGRPAPGMIEVGAALFDERIHGAAREGFLRAMRNGATPAESSDAAKAEAQLWIQKHNEKRPRDVTWQRWIGGGDTIAISLARRFAGIEVST